MPRLAKYRTSRSYENLTKGIFPSCGQYGFPEILPTTSITVSEWVPFNSFNTVRHPERKGLHFFLDDYQFERVWLYPEKYLLGLSRFSAVLSPDFSPYSDFPKAIQLYNHYRKHWLAAYWQSNGITVIPTITWSSPDTLEWAFDGEPVGGIVAISSVGMFDTDEHTAWLIDGYSQMIQALSPIMVLWKGTVPEQCQSSIIVKIPSHTDKFRRSVI